MSSHAVYSGDPGTVDDSSTVDTFPLRWESMACSTGMTWHWQVAEGMPFCIVLVLRHHLGDSWLSTSRSACQLHCLGILAIPRGLSADSLDIAQSPVRTPVPVSLDSEQIHVCHGGHVAL